MDIEQAILEKIRRLPADKQQEVLNFAEFLCQKMIPKASLGSVKGIWATLDMDLREEDITQARTEMWNHFIREDA